MVEEAGTLAESRNRDCAGKGRSEGRCKLEGQSEGRCKLVGRGRCDAAMRCESRSGLAVAQTVPQQRQTVVMQPMHELHQRVGGDATGAEMCAGVCRCMQVVAGSKRVLRRSGWLQVVTGLWLATREGSAGRVGGRRVAVWTVDGVFWRHRRGGIGLGALRFRQGTSHLAASDGDWRFTHSARGPRVEIQEGQSADGAARGLGAGGEGVGEGEGEGAGVAMDAGGGVLCRRPTREVNTRKGPRFRRQLPQDGAR